MIKIFNKSKVGSVVAQPLGVLAALVEDLGLVPTPAWWLTTIHNFCSRETDAF